MQAVSKLTTPGADAMRAREILATEVLKILLNRTTASMHGERALAVMRDGGQELC